MIPTREEASQALLNWVTRPAGVAFAGPDPDWTVIESVVKAYANGELVRTVGLDEVLVMFGYTREDLERKEDTPQ